MNTPTSRTFVRNRLADSCAVLKRARLALIASLVLLPVHAALALNPASDPSNTGGWVANSTFTDEFNDGSFDTGKWYNTCSFWGGRAPSWFNTANVWEGSSSGVQGVVLTTKWETKPGSPSLTIGAACVQSKTKAHYGYYEVRAKMSNAASSSAFWFHSQDGSPQTEIDVYEACGNSTLNSWFNNQVSFNTYVHSTPPQTNQQYYDVGSRVADAFHVYGLEWSATQIKWYVDGVLRKTATNTVHTVPEFLLLDTEVFTDWFGMPSTSQLPAWYVVDYVRAWTKSGGGGGGGNTHGGTWAAKAALSSTAGFTRLTAHDSTVQASTAYTAKIWVKGAGKVKVQVANAGWGTTPLGTKDVTATSTWTQHSIPFTSPSGNTIIHFNVYDALGGTAGTVYFDDVTVIRDGGSTNVVANPGFESASASWLPAGVFTIVQP